MLIAFEGPDKTGKSTSAAALDPETHSYNLTKKLYEDALFSPSSAVHTFDRIDWLTHLVYRLALPKFEWNDERPRTVFTAPDLHLVIKLHSTDTVAHIDDELYKRGTLKTVNEMYGYFANFLMGLNRTRDYALFRTISIMQVTNDRGEFSQKLVDFDSPTFTFGTVASRLVKTDADLVNLLRYDEQHRLP